MPRSTTADLKAALNRLARFPGHRLSYEKSATGYSLYDYERKLAGSLTVREALLFLDGFEEGKGPTKAEPQPKESGLSQRMCPTCGGIKSMTLDGKSIKPSKWVQYGAANDAGCIC